MTICEFMNGVLFMRSDTVNGLNVVKTCKFSGQNDEISKLSGFNRKKYKFNDQNDENVQVQWAGSVLCLLVNYTRAPILKRNHMPPSHRSYKRDKVYFSLKDTDGLTYAPKLIFGSIILKN